ncbi:hypothetical protein EG328_009528 [Venturia inaequalis]|uniref:Uncharacterized protein n=1 Tax=Venturia inaequalis TaxID=5025 RepID=A0A8H3V9P9_VENIN|nr:hypothetical protein EG328_009528 [Venturia inaequalis]RDI87433.1 hypothetical protein Vi05172_g2367 [Venturia inaequalis]
MLLIIILTALIGLFSTQTLARPPTDPSFPYKIVPLHWNVPTTPSGPKITVTGTVQDVIASLTAANPNWKRDFKFDHIAEAPAHIKERDDWPWIPSSKLCAPDWSWGWAKIGPIQKGITYLQKQPGMPYLDAGPGACARISCSEKAAIYWCNDLLYPRVMGDYAYLAEGVQRIIDKCKRNEGKKGWMTKGQVFNVNAFNVVVRYDDSLGC